MPACGNRRGGEGQGGEGQGGGDCHRRGKGAEDRARGFNAIVHVRVHLLAVSVDETTGDHFESTVVLRSSGYLPCLARLLGLS